MTDRGSVSGRTEFIFRMDTIMAWVPEEPYIRLYDKDERLIFVASRGELKRLLKHVLDVRTIMRFDIGYLEGVSRALNEHIFDRAFKYTTKNRSKF